MSKYLTSLIAIMAISFFAHAQVDLGVKLGLNNTRLNVESLYNYKVRSAVTPYLALYTNIEVSDAFSVNVELTYQQKGAFLEGFPMEYLLLKFDYLSFPFMVNYRFGDKWSVNLGGEYGHMKFNNLPLIDGDTNYDAVNRADFGILTGIRYDFSKRFNIEMRYIHGLMDVSNIDEPTYNRTLNFSVGYHIFKFGKGSD